MARLRGARATFGDERGFSLVELLVAITLLGLLGTGTVGVVLANMRSQRFATELRDEVESVRVAMDRLRKDIRSTRHVRSTSTARDLVLWLDVNQNHVAETGEIVTYTLEDDGGGNAQLRRWTDAQGAGGGMVVARDLELADAFAYDLAPQATENVTITLTAVSDSPTGPNQLQSQTVVRVRNV